MQNGNEKEFGESDVGRTNILIFTTYLILTLDVACSRCRDTRLGWYNSSNGEELNPIPSKV